MSYELPVIGVIQAQSASDYSRSREAHYASRTCMHSFSSLPHKNKQRGKGHLMFKQSLHMKGRDRKRKTDTGKRQKADSAQNKRKRKKHNPTIKIH